jgi:MFS-type transporter involved in bile tolerance (Atg22 family)
VYISSALTLIALGAILAFAVDYEIAGVNIDMVGIILMIVGVVGAILSLTVWRRPASREVVREREPR